MRIRFITISLIMCAGLSCKKDDKSSPSNNPPPEKDGGSDVENIGPGDVALGTVDFAVTAVNGLDLENSQVSSDAGQAKVGNLAVATAGLKSFDLAKVGQDIPSPAAGQKGELNGITSGPPSGFKIVVTKINFKGPTSSITVFESPGAEISIEGAKVDLTALFAAIGNSQTEGSAASLKVPVGSYNEIEVTYRSKAQIKGCVSGLFDSGTKGKLYQTVPAGSTGIAVDDPIPEYTGEHEYCTQTAKSLYNVTENKLEKFFYNEDFEKTTSTAKTPEWMAIEIGKYPTWDFQPTNGGPAPSPHSTDESETVTMAYTLLKPVEVKENESLDLTMVIDMNRLLRYETGATQNHWGSEKNRPSENYPSVRNPSFFFDSTFRGSTFVFAGKPGGIYGYEVLSLVCTDEFHDPDTFRCDDPNSATVGQDSYYAVETWMTLITDSSGAPLSLLIQPKDDTRLTTFVGSHIRNGKWVFPSADGKTADIRYSLGDDFLGTLYGFPALLDDYVPVAANSPDNPAAGHFTLLWDLHKLDDTYGGAPVYSEDVIKGGNGPGNGDQQGAAVFWRRL